jgi:lysophospholipase L1-like esterase
MGPILGGRPLVRAGDAAKTKMVFAGNSIVNGGNNATTSWWAKLSLLAPISNAYTVTNLGHDGWGITQLDAAADTGPQFVAGKDNVLLFYEGTNTLKGGGTSPATAISQLQAYITNRLAEHAWKIVLVSTIPFIEGASDAVSATQNANVDTFNAYLRANYKAMGAVAYIDVRTGAPWGSLPNYNLSSFQATCSALYNSDYTHPNAAGNQLLADLMAPQLRRIPLR